MEPHTEVAAAENTARAREIRRRLPGQMLEERLETARLYFGPLHTLDEIRTRVARTLSHRIGFVRGATLEPIMEKLYHQEWHYFFENTCRWRDLRKITIAQVQGNAISAGLMLIWACDLIVAADNAKLFHDNAARVYRL